MARSSVKGDDWLFPTLATESEVAQSSLLDIIDNVLNHGVVLHGELILGVANVDLIYAKLSVLLAALDKLQFQAKRGRVPSGGVRLKRAGDVRLQPDPPREKRTRPRSKK